MSENNNQSMGDLFPDLGPEVPIISGVAHDSTESLATVRRVPNEPGMAAKVFTMLAEAGVNVDMIVQAGASEADIDARPEWYAKLYPLVSERLQRLDLTARLGNTQIDDDLRRHRSAHARHGVKRHGRGGLRYRDIGLGHKPRVGMRDGNVGSRHGKPRGIGILTRADGVEPALGNETARGKLALEPRKHLIRRRTLPIKKHQLRRKQRFVIRHALTSLT